MGLALVSLLVPGQPSRPSRAQPDETSLGPLFPYCAPVRIPDGCGAGTERDAALAGGEEKYPADAPVGRLRRPRLWLRT